MLHFITTENITAFFTLTALEIVLGVDNILFIAILLAKLPERDRKKTRLLGVSLALIFRVLLLFSLTWIMGLRSTWFLIANHEVTGRDALLIAGGLFLVVKSSFEFLGSTQHRKPPALKNAVIQIMIVDIIFSFDSAITAVGMVKSLLIMIMAISASMLMMLWISDKASVLIDKNPRIKTLALSFLILIGLSLIADGINTPVDKNYIYAAIVVALSIELLIKIIIKIKEKYYF